MNRKPQYFTYNDQHVAVIFKNGSSAIGKAIRFAITPDFQINPNRGQEYLDKMNNRAGWQAGVPKTDSPFNPIIPVRDPVERFRSACAQEGRTVKEALAKCEAGDFSMHFEPVTTWLITDSRLFRFPDHLQDIADLLGIDEIPPVNDSATNNGPKPDLTPEELARVEAIYTDDIALFGSITEAGQVWTAPVIEPEPEPVPQQVTPRQIRLALIDRGIMPEQITQMLSGIEDEVLRAKSLAEWEFASVVKRNHPLIAQLAGALEFGAEDVDDVFREAKAIGD
jgi:hypothetical protein